MNKKKSSDDSWGKVFDTTANSFDKLNRQFWDPPAQMTVDQLKLKPGMNVLDVGSGSGSTAIPMAELVGNNGKVTGIDLSDELLIAGRKKAKQKRLKNIIFEKKDLRMAENPENYFDIVVFEFSIFFVPDMEKQITKFWQMVKPGGKLAITTWGKKVLSPLYEKWFQILESIDPKLKEFDRPWENPLTTDVQTLKQLMIICGIPGSSLLVRQVIDSIGISPEEAETYILGTGLRAGLPMMTPGQKVQALNELRSALKRDEIRHLISDPILALAIK